MNTGRNLLVLLAIGSAHLLNDTMQSVLPAIYPLLKETIGLTFFQIGLIAFVFQMTGSILQPFIGWVIDRKPMAYSASMGMIFTFSGLMMVAFSPSFEWLLCAVTLIGIGSSIFHPEASRVAYLASGGQRGLAQSIFQVGGNLGSALGPLLAAFIIMPWGQRAASWTAALAILGGVILTWVARWVLYHPDAKKSRLKSTESSDQTPVLTVKNGAVVGLLIILMTSKFFYTVCMLNYFSFFLIHKFSLTIQQAQIHLFVFLFAVVIGTLLGGPIGDRMGRKYVILASIVGSAPFTILLSHGPLYWVDICAVLSGICLASAFPTIVVYAQELLPGRVGTISGLFFGLAFGLAGIAAVLIGYLADQTSIQFVFQLVGYLPLLGIIAVFLPNIRVKK